MGGSTPLPTFTSILMALKVKGCFNNWYFFNWCIGAFFNWCRFWWYLWQFGNNWPITLSCLSTLIWLLSRIQTFESIWGGLDKMGATINGLRSWCFWALYWFDCWAGWRRPGGVDWPPQWDAACVLPAVWWQRAEVGSLESTNQSTGSPRPALSLVESWVSPEVIGVGEF